MSEIHRTYQRVKIPSPGVGESLPRTRYGGEGGSSEHTHPMYTMNFRNRTLERPDSTTGQQLGAALQYAYSTFTTYRDLFESAGVGADVLAGTDPLDILELLPVISADTLARVGEESLTVVEGIVDMETSSGTTGVRKKRFISYEDDRNDHDFMAELFRVAGINERDRVACLDTDPVYLMVSFARALDLLGVDESYVYSVGRDQGQTLDALVRLDPTAIFAVPSMFERCWPSLRRLYDEAGRGSLSKVVFLGERVPHRLRAQLESKHGVEVFSYYGAAETSSLGIECTAHTGIHLYTDRNLFELSNTNSLSPTGEEIQRGGREVTNSPLSLEGEGLPRTRYGGEGDHTPSPVVGEGWGEGDHTPSPVVGEGWGEGDHTPSPVVGEGWGEGDHTPSPVVGESWGEGETAPTGEEMQTGALADTNNLSPTGEEMQTGALADTNRLSPTGEEMQTGARADTNNLSPAGEEMQTGARADTNNLSPTGEEMQTGARADTNNLSPAGEEIQRGGLVVTSLLQKTVPLVRYSLGDEIVLLPGDCPCGLPHPRVDVLGRAGDSFAILGSTFHYDSFLRSVYKNLDEVGYMQVVLTTEAQDVLTVLLPAETRPHEKRMKDSLLSDQLELEFLITSKLASLRFDYVDESYFTGSRKMKLVDDRRQKEATVQTS